MADITDIVHRTDVRAVVLRQDGKAVLLIQRLVYTGGNEEKPDTKVIIGRFECRTAREANRLAAVFRIGVRMGHASGAGWMDQPYLDREVNCLPRDPSCN